MMRAADYMHSISIIHRDLKPRNVLVSSGLRAHVIDLGLAIDISDPADRRVAAKKVVGTQGYMPPESLRGETATFAVDMWALGVMLYEMAFGFAPFLAHELLLPSKVEFPDASWGFKVSPELSSLLSVLLDKDAAKRGSATQALQHAWFEEGVVLAADRHLTEVSAHVCNCLRLTFLHACPCASRRDNPADMASGGGGGTHASKRRLAAGVDP